MGGAVPIGCTAISGGIGAATVAAFGEGTGTDECVDLVASWTCAEVLAAAARMESATYAELVAAWARAEVLSATARMGSAAAVARAGARRTASILAIILLLTATGKSPSFNPPVRLSKSSNDPSVMRPRPKL